MYELSCIRLLFVNGLNDNDIHYETVEYIDRLVQKRCNTSALALGLRLFCNHPSIYCVTIF